MVLVSNGEVCACSAIEAYTEGAELKFIQRTASLSSGS